VVPSALGLRRNRPRPALREVVARSGLRGPATADDGTRWNVDADVKCALIGVAGPRNHFHKTAAGIEPSRSPAAGANILPSFQNTISLLQRRFLSASRGIKQERHWFIPNTSVAIPLPFLARHSKPFCCEIMQRSPGHVSPMARNREMALTVPVVLGRSFLTERRDDLTGLGDLR